MSAQLVSDLVIRHNFMSWVNQDGIPCGIWADPYVEFGGPHIEGTYNYRDWAASNLPVFGEPLEVNGDLAKARRRPDDSHRDIHDFKADLKYWVKDSQVMFQTYYTFSGHPIDKFPALAVLTPDEMLIFSVPAFSTWDYHASLANKKLEDMTIGELRQCCPLLMRHNVYIGEGGKLRFARLFHSRRQMITPTMNLPPVHLSRAGQVLVRRLKRSIPTRAPAFDMNVFACRAFEVQKIIDEIQGFSDDKIDFGDILHRAKHSKMTRMLTLIHEAIVNEIDTMTAESIYTNQRLPELITQYNIEASAVVRAEMILFLRSKVVRETPFLANVPADWVEGKTATFDGQSVSSFA